MTRHTPVRLSTKLAPGEPHRGRSSALDLAPAELSHVVARHTREEGQGEGTVEADLLWSFTARTAAASGSRPSLRRRCRTQWPGLYRYLAPWLTRYQSRSGYRRDFSADFPWALSGPTERLRSSGALLCVRYLATGGRPAAAVAVEREVPALGRRTLPIPNNKSNIYYCAENEAHYLAAFVNSRPAQEALGRFAVSTGVTPGALARLPLARFDDENEQHRNLAELGRAAAAVVQSPDQLKDVERQIDEAVWRLSSL